MRCAIEECGASAVGWATVGPEGAIVQHGHLAEVGMSIAVCERHLTTANQIGMLSRRFKAFTDPNPGGGEHVG